MTLVRAAMLGAAAMYFLDPDRGRRRRALVRDKAQSALSQGGQFLSAARSDARSRMQGVRALAQRVQRRDDDPDDQTLVQRARSRLGRVVAHPHAVRITADQGQLRITGAILRREHAPLLAAMRLVRGVKAVDDSALTVHDSADGVPALQGASRGSMRNGRNASWTPAVRLSAIAGGGALALYGLSCSGLSKLAFSGAGLALVARGGFNKPLRSLFEEARDSAAQGASMTEHAVEDDDTDSGDDWSRATHRSAYETGASQYLQQSGGGVSGQQGGGNRSTQQAQRGTGGAQQWQGASSGAQPPQGTAGGSRQSQDTFGAARQAQGGMGGGQQQGMGAGVQQQGLRSGAGGQYAYPDSARMQETGSETGAYPPERGAP